MALRRRRHRYEVNADINVVSLIDVMLLLLVIFMITAPMMQGGVDITLPKTEAKPIESKEGLTISVNRAGQIYIGDAKYNSLSEFRIVFKTLPKNRTQSGVYLRQTTTPTTASWRRSWQSCMGRASRMSGSSLSRRRSNRVTAARAPRLTGGAIASVLLHGGLVAA